MNRSSILVAAVSVLVCAIVLALLGDTAKAQQCGNQTVSSLNLSASDFNTGGVQAQPVGLFGRLGRQGGGGCGGGGCGQSSSSIRINHEATAAPAVMPQNGGSFSRRLEINSQSGGCANGQCDQSSAVNNQMADKLAQALDSIGQTLQESGKRLERLEQRQEQDEFDTVGWGGGTRRSFQLEYQSSGSGYGAASRAAYFTSPKPTPVRDAIEAARIARAQRLQQRAEQKLMLQAMGSYGY